MKKAIQVRELENLEMTLKYAAEAGFNDVSIGFDSSKASMFIGDDYKKKLNNICELLNKYNLNCVQTYLPAPYHLLVSSETVDEISENKDWNDIFYDLVAIFRIVPPVQHTIYKTTFQIMQTC